MREIAKAVHSLKGIKKIEVGLRPHPVNSTTTFTANTPLLVLHLARPPVEKTFLIDLHRKLNSSGLNYRFVNQGGGYFPILQSPLHAKRAYTVRGPVKTQEGWEIHVLPSGFDAINEKARVRFASRLINSLRKT